MAVSQRACETVFGRLFFSPLGDASPFGGHSFMLGVLGSLLTSAALGIIVMLLPVSAENNPVNKDALGQASPGQAMGDPGQIPPGRAEIGTGWVLAVQV